MEDFLKKMERDIEMKIMSCVRGESIIKPFSQVYDKVRVVDINIEVNKSKPLYFNKSIYVDKERSIYEDAIQKFLKENPDFLEKLDAN